MSVNVHHVVMDVHHVMTLIVVILVRMNFICLQQNVYLVDPVAKHVILRDAKLAVLDIFPIPQIMYKNVILALMDVIIVKQVMDKHVPHAHLVFIKKDQDVIKVLLVVPFTIVKELVSHANMVLD